MTDLLTNIALNVVRFSLVFSWSRGKGKTQKKSHADCKSKTRRSFLLWVRSLFIYFYLAIESNVDTISSIPKTE